MRIRSLLLIVLLAIVPACKKKRSTTSAEFTAASQALQETISRTLDPSYAHPDFVKVERMMRQVPEDCPDHGTALALADAIAEGQRKERAGEVTRLKEERDRETMERRKKEWLKEQQNRAGFAPRAPGVITLPAEPTPQAPPLAAAPAVAKAPTKPSVRTPPKKTEKPEKASTYCATADFRTGRKLTYCTNLAPAEAKKHCEKKHNRDCECTADRSFIGTRCK